MRPNRKGNSIKWWLTSAIAFLILASASLVEAQTIQTLCSFDNANGANPEAGLTLGNDGNFYGTTSGGGVTSGVGTVFRVTTNGTLTTLVSFAGTNGVSSHALTLGTDGNFYGTFLYGSSGVGTVFRVTANGTWTTLVSFDGSTLYGGLPNALTLGMDSNFYGTTSTGGNNGVGTVFRVTTNGTLTTLGSFDASTGRPNSLTPGKDGNFYGTTSTGGDSGVGTVFRVTTNGTLTTLVSFAGNMRYGISPSPLTLGTDGNFYGTTLRDGSSGVGTVFRVKTNGTLTTLVSFDGTNGVSPHGLTLGTDGNFYGTTYQGGKTELNSGHGWGTLFRVTTDGALTTLVSFDGSNGGCPVAAPTQGNDGKFYGTTEYGGSSGAGEVFRLLFPPIITVQPQSQTSNSGTTVTFLVSATGLNPMYYQWQKNGSNLVDGVNISGATTTALTITAISDSDAGTYSVVLTNVYGSVTSSNATLTVIIAPAITAQPSSLLVLGGTNVAFEVAPSGSAPFFYYQWQFNGINILNGTSALYSIPSVGTNNAGYYAVVVTNLAGSTTSSNAALTVVLSPKSRTNYASSTATFTATAFSPESLNYQWQKNGTNLVNGGRLSGTTNNTLTIASVSDADVANYSAVVSDATGSVTTSNAVLTVNDLPFIASQPQSQTVSAGRMVTFNVTAYGAPPLVFQWNFNGTPVGSPVTGTNVSSYALTNVGTNQAGNYSVEVVNGYGRVTSSIATLTVVVPPIIITQPLNRTNNVATTASFSVVATSASLLSYRWQKNGTNLANGGKISGVTNSTLAITNVSDNDAAVYSVTVTNIAGSVASSNATLTVIDAPSITAQPLSQRVLLASSASFRVSVSGTPPFSYQWRFNGTNLLNATNAAYAIQAVDATNTGKYSVVVTNFAGSVTSFNALLTVIVPPTLALQFLAGYPLLDLSGMLSSNFVVQYSTNLVGTNWANLLSLTNLPSSPYRLLDAGGVGQPWRFYRAFMQ